MRHHRIRTLDRIASGGFHHGWRSLAAAAAIAAVVALCAATHAQAASQSVAGTSRQTLFGTSSFPFDRSAEAAVTTQRTARELGDLYVVQLDDGVPWAEALEDKPFPVATERKWRDLLANAPAGRPIYLALEPLDHDRVNLAAASEGSSVPTKLRRAALDDEAMRRAYLNYSRRAVDYFKPTFLNLGVENGELAHRDPGRWPAYERLIKSTMSSLRKDFPKLRQGISFGLQSLMEPETAKRSKPLVEASDYLGLSFYPYMSNFHEKFRVRPLPAPPGEWREPLDWVRAYTNKPIAITETGYNTRAVQLPAEKIRLQGTPDLQAAYVRDLARYAARDRYLFVVYYLPIDIGPLLRTLPASESAAASMWRENGFFDANMKPKPALEEWRRILAQPYVSPVSLSTAGAQTTPVASTGTIGFTRDQDLCQTPQPGQTRLVKTDAGADAMLWQYERRPGKWAWCSRKMPAGTLPRGSGMKMRIRSENDVVLILQLKQSNGTTHFAGISAGPEWRDVELRWKDFSLDEKTGRDPAVHPENVVEFVLADEGQHAKKSGDRQNLWISLWHVK